MHYYDPNTGRRVKAVLKKDGTPYKAVPRKVIAERGYVPGVTDIMKYASPYTGLAMYERRVAIVETIKHMASVTNTEVSDLVRAQVNEAVRFAIDQPANEGTRKHWAFEKGCKATLRGLDGVDKQIALSTYSAIRTIFKDGFTVVAEMEFCAPEYGGTMDMVVFREDRPVCLIDAKFPTSERETRDTECIQLAAYRNYLLTRYGVSDIMTGNWLYDAQGNIYKRRQYTRAQLARGWDCFQSMLASWKNLRALGDALKEKVEMELTPFPDVS